MAEINPLRYRGYYYDTETGFYYLQSRYYDPEICRFINADSYASSGQGILGHNAFIYCSNSPVIYIDATGEDWINTLVQYGFDVAEKVLQEVQYQVGKLDLCISFGVTGSVSPGIISFSQSAIIAIDTQGNIELQYQSNSVGVTTSGSFGASVTTSMSVIRSTSLDNLSETGYAFGSSAFSPFYGLGDGFDYSISEGYHNGFPQNYYGYSTSAGIGVPSAPDIHGNVSKSKTVPGTRYNLFDVAYRMIHRARRKCEKWLEK